jgi:hypothetical protein
MNEITPIRNDALHSTTIGTIEPLVVEIFHLHHSRLLDVDPNNGTTTIDGPTTVGTTVGTIVGTTTKIVDGTTESRAVAVATVEDVAAVAVIETTTTRRKNDEGVPPAQNERHEMMPLELKAEAVLSKNSSTIDKKTPPPQHHEQNLEPLKWSDKRQPHNHPLKKPRLSTSLNPHG